MSVSGRALCELNSTLLGLLENAKTVRVSGRLRSVDWINRLMKTKKIIAFKSVWSTLLLLLQHGPLSWSLYANLLAACFFTSRLMTRVAVFSSSFGYATKIGTTHFPCSFRFVFCRPSFGRNEISCTYLPPTYYSKMKKKKKRITCCSCFFFVLFFVERGIRRSGSREVKKHASDKDSV